jgi:hypothetical protein
MRYALWPARVFLPRDAERPATTLRNAELSVAVEGAHVGDASSVDVRRYQWRLSLSLDPPCR